jgi:hypothetical protein
LRESILHHISIPEGRFVMIDEEALQKVVFPIDWYLDKTSHEKSRMSALKNVRNPRLLGHVLEKVSKGGKLMVQFDVPKAIECGLKTGEYVRKGGVIVTSDGRKVVHWLKEGTSVKRIGSAVTVLTLLVDIWSEYALNEKLKQIQEQLRRIEGKIDAEYLARFLSAHDSLKDALGAIEESNRIAWFRKSIERFQDARNETYHRLLDIIKKNHSQFVDFHTSRVHNASELLDIYNNLGSIQDHSDRISHCYRAEALIHERLNEFGNAERLRVQALDFHLDACEYLTFFGVGRSSYGELGLVRLTGLDTTKVRLSKGGTDLHKQVKHFGDISSYSPIQLLREKIPRPPQNSAFWSGLSTAADYQLAILDLPGTAAKHLCSRSKESIEEAHRGIAPALEQIENQVPAHVFELT